ncbi:hypothetical protein [Vulcanisaeta distributa]|uniref:hypothetical protein n=1 Tax=Vulcanisaeta distributa TaxID=164451 RepID=UPI001FB2EE49|nr:hypothetical protein [Vulcanisaeta distributa]
MPTPNGYAYIELPHNSFIGLPTYLLIMATAIALLNMLTRARWLRLRGGGRLPWPLRNTAYSRRLNRHLTDSVFHTRRLRTVLP